MKKGFTMIELIFVIVILGILASVAIPRLAGTRTDAEVATTVANLRTIVSEVSSYYVAHGSFDGVKWRDLTNVPLKSDNTGAAIEDTLATTIAYLKAGEANNCIGITAVIKDTATKRPAHIKFTKATGATGVCAEVLDADPVKALLDSEVKHPNTGAGGGTTTIDNAIAIGSTTSVYSK